MDTPSLIVGLLGGGLITWLVAHQYYRRQLRDQEQYHRRLQSDLGSLTDRLIDRLVERKFIIQEKAAEARSIARRAFFVTAEGIRSAEAFGTPTLFVGPSPIGKTVTDVSAKQALGPEDTPPGESQHQ